MPTPTPSYVIALPAHLPAGSAARLAVLSRWYPQVALAANDVAPAARLAWAAAPPAPRALLLRQEPVVAVTHVLSHTAHASTGQLRAWASGQAAGPRLVLGDDGALTRTVLGLDRLAEGAVAQPGWEAARRYVATHPDAWALLPWEAVRPEVQAMRVDGVAPDPRHGDYPLARRLWLVEERALPTGVAGSLHELLRYEPAPTVELVAVGDIMLARLVGERLDAFGLLYPFEGEGLQPLLHGADVAFGNLECAISERGVKQDKGYNFRARPAVTTTLTYAGFDVLSLANNHTGDYADVALTDTLKLLDEAGIAAVGAGETITQAHACRMVAANDLKLGFLAYNEIGPSWFAAEADSPGSAWMEPARMAEDVAACRALADVVVVSVHWGIEYTPYATDAQQQAAQALADAGAALVLGHHPHVVQGLGFYPGTYVAFSLGNFIFDQGLSAETEEGLVLRALLDPTGVKTVELLRQATTASQPRLVGPEDAREMLDRVLRVTKGQGLLPR